LRHLIGSWISVGLSALKSCAGYSKEDDDKKKNNKRGAAGAADFPSKHHIFW